jgi:hypothetical protein
LMYLNLLYVNTSTDIGINKPPDFLAASVVTDPPPARPLPADPLGPQGPFRCTQIVLATLGWLTHPTRARGRKAALAL